VLAQPQKRRGRASLLLALGILAGAAVTGCREASPERVLDMETHLTRQIADLRTLVERAERGRLVPTDGVIVAVREDVVRRMVQLTLPHEEVVQGRFRVRLERVDVRFRDRHGAVQLEGRVAWADDADLYRADVSVDLTVFGRVDAVAIDAEEGTLTAEMVPIGFEIRDLRVREQQPTVRRLAEALARALPESLSTLRSTMTIPVAFEHRLRLSGLEAGPVRLREASLPLKLVVQDASAHGGRLWVSVRVGTAPAGAGGER
jgi:hypothetical protein